uniref:Apolipoprotein M n=1 Tax=Oryzias latipes TaxID=8090 RepID=A0A3B3HNG2_ORYLA
MICDLHCYMLPLYAIALLCWVSVSRSAPTPCEELVRPSDQVNFPDLKDSRVLVLASAKDPLQAEKLKSRDSVTISFDNHTDSSEMFLKRSYSFGDRCEYVQSNITVEGSSFSFAEYNISVSFLRSSCADCITMVFNKSSQGPVRLYLFSRRREVNLKESEEFTAQAKCFNMSPTVVMDPTKELCPEQMEKQSP